MSLQNRVAAHEITKLLLGHAQPRLLKIAQGLRKNQERIREFQRENRRMSTPVERYCLDGLSALHSVMHGLARIENARAFLKASPSGLKSKAARVNRDEWTEYHFAFWTVALASILDQALIATAQLLELGFPPRLCTLDNVSSHSTVGRPTVSALRSLNRVLEGHKQRRHRILHRGEAANFGELTDPEFLADLRTITFVATADPSFGEEEAINRLWAHALKELMPELESAMDQMTTAVDGVLDSLLPSVRTKLLVYESLAQLQSATASVESVLPMTS